METWWNPRTRFWNSTNTLCSKWPDGLKKIDHGENYDQLYDKTLNAVQKTETVTLKYTNTLCSKWPDGLKQIDRGENYDQLYDKTLNAVLKTETVTLKYTNTLCSKWPDGLKQIDHGENYDQLYDKTLMMLKGDRPDTTPACFVMLYIISLTFIVLL